MKQRLLPFLLIALQFLIAGNASAEKADSQKPYTVAADNLVDDDVKQIRTWTGNVVMIQGTMIMKGTKLVVTTSPDGYDFATLYAPAGSLATMRQKRDGGPDLWMEGEASDRITYDQKTSIAKLYLKAKIRRLTGIKPTDEAAGTFLSYNSQTEIVTGESKPGDPRVVVIIQPHADTKGK